MGSMCFVLCVKVSNTKFRHGNKAENRQKLENIKKKILQKITSSPNITPLCVCVPVTPAGVRTGWMG